MIIIFFNQAKNEILVASSASPLRAFSVGDPNIYNHIPYNEDVYYVQNVNIITREQLVKWIGQFAPVNENVSVSVDPNVAASSTGKFYLHTRGNGSVILEDIRNDAHPNGVTLNGKYGFVPIDSIGGLERLQASPFYNFQMKKGKIEIVDEKYVRENIHKARQISPIDIALNRLLIDDSRAGAADAYAEGRRAGEIPYPDEAIPIDVRGDDNYGPRY